jgi:hypothetical protein
MSKSITKEELKALIPHDSRVYYCRTSRGICVVQTADADVLAILSGDETAAVARRARLIASMPLLLDAVGEEVLAQVAERVAWEPAEGDRYGVWPPPEWRTPS